MLLFHVKFAARWLGPAALVLLGVTATAQQTIPLSQPVWDDPTNKANAFLPDTSRYNSAGAFNAPIPLFGARGPSASFDILPGSPPPPISAADALQFQKAFNDKKNWALMTPEEILGVSTPEQILGIADPNYDPSLTPEERYLQSQSRQYAIGVSNAVHRAAVSVWSSGDFADGSLDANSRFAGRLDDSERDPARALSSLFGQRVDAVSQPNSTWSSPFDSPTPLPKPLPAQLAGMESFRALLDPPPPEKPRSAFVLQPAATPGPNLQSLPAYNPAGGSPRVLISDLIRPVGLTPLPGVTGPQAPAKKTAPLVRPPPWMQDPLQNSTLPQRQY